MTNTAKLYFVTYKITAVVTAEDESHAFQVANDEQRDVLREASNPSINIEREVKSERDMRDGWDEMCIPYGGDRNTRIGELLDNARKA